MVDDKSKDDAWDNKEFNAERVVVAVVSCLEFHPHQVDGSDGSSKEENLELHFLK